jgi:hypothetical protein
VGYQNAQHQNARFLWNLRSIGQHAQDDRIGARPTCFRCFHKDNPFTRLDPRLSGDEELALLLSGDNQYAIERADPAGSFVALFSLAASDAPAARSLLGTLRRRHGQGHPLPTDDLAAHERFALDLGLALVAARGEELLDVSALRDGLLPGRDVATRLASASGLLARISDGLSHIDTRWTLSDALVGALANERDRDVAWLELLALRQLHIGEAWLPSRTIGYGAEDGLDPERAGRRTATFLAYLSDTNPATRRVAVFGLLGTSDTRGVEPALTAALAVEPDRRIAQWMRLALLRL